MILIVVRQEIKRIDSSVVVHKLELALNFLMLVLLNVFKPASVFFGCSKAVLLLWTLFVIYVSCLSLLYCLVCSLQPCGHLLGKG